ncbi:hypothetical protein AAF712_003994 [Marasmius tenuissimus]|uniref:DUF6697 domain-containing protein n=1 Tax=Marasmius tenuissimus TaxID=585030 RepID=A0ABR3A6N4_9AGAR
MPVAKTEDLNSELEAFALPGSPPPDSDDSNDDSDSGTLVNSSEPSASPEPFERVLGSDSTPLKPEIAEVNGFLLSKEMRGDRPDSPIAIDFSDNEDEEAIPGVAVGTSEPTWDEETTNEARSRLKALRNPKTEVKKGYDPDAWPVQTIARFIDGIPEFKVDAEDVDIDFPVPRYFLSKVFGGGPFQTNPDRSQEKWDEMEAEGFETCEWACLVAGYNPYMPTIPGKPGLAFSCASSETIDIDFLKQQPPYRQRVIACLSPNKWLYVGQYESSFIFCLPKEEWLGLPSQVKKSWAKGICEKDWGRELRIKVLLVNRPGSGRVFSQAQFEQLSASRNRSFKGEITEQQVIESFDRGEIRITIDKMKCVAYELEFQRKIVREHPDWKRKQEKKEAEKKQKREQKQQGAGNKRKRGRNEMKGGKGKAQKPAKKKRVEPPSASADAVEYVPSGTRSRPKASRTRKPAKSRD